MDPFVTLTAAAAVDQDLEARHRRLPGDPARHDPDREARSPRSTRCRAAGSCSASAAAGTRTRWRTTARSTRRASSGCASRSRRCSEIWTKTKPEYHGDIVDFPPMMTWPKPVQKPHPPVIVGGAFPHAARRAVRYGNGWIPIAGRGAYGNIDDYCRRIQGDAGRGRPQPRRRADHDVRRRADARSVKRYRDLGVPASSAAARPSRPTRPCRCSTNGRACAR